MGQSRSNYCNPQHKEFIPFDRLNKERPRILGKYKKKGKRNTRTCFPAWIFRHLIFLFTCGRKSSKKRINISNAEIFKRDSYYHLCHLSGNRRSHLIKTDLTTARTEPDVEELDSSRQTEPPGVNFKMTVPEKSQTSVNNNNDVSHDNDLDKMIEDLEAIYAKMEEHSSKQKEPSDMDFNMDHGKSHTPTNNEVSYNNDLDKLIDGMDAILDKMEVLSSKQMEPSDVDFNMDHGKSHTPTNNEVSHDNDLDKLIEEADALCFRVKVDISKQMDEASYEDDLDKLIEEADALCFSMEVLSSKQMEPSDVDFKFDHGKSHTPTNNEVSNDNDLDKLIEEADALCFRVKADISKQMDEASYEDDLDCLIEEAEVIVDTVLNPIRSS